MSCWKKNFGSGGVWWCGRHLRPDRHSRRFSDPLNRTDLRVLLLPKLFAWKSMITYYLQNTRGMLFDSRLLIQYTSFPWAIEQFTHSSLSFYNLFRTCVVFSLQQVDLAWETPELWLLSQVLLACAHCEFQRSLSTGVEWHNSGGQLSPEAEGWDDTAGMQERREDQRG